MRQTGSVIVRLAREKDAPGFIELAGQVEHWFGPMVGEPGFQTAVAKHIRRGTALVAAADESNVIRRRPSGGWCGHGRRAGSSA